jgi:hypothetical protein
MQTVGDPWLRDRRNSQPEAGSDLALDDAESPASSPLAHRVLVMALDHLGFVVDAVFSGPPKRLNAPISALRTALECGARVRWLLESDSSNERRLRAIRYRFENLEEQRKAITDMSGTHMVGEQDEARAQVLAWVTSETTTLGELALRLGASNLNKPPDTLNILKSMIDLNTYAGTAFIQLWRQGSASVHGHYWADAMRGNNGTFDTAWFHTAVQGTMLFINEAMKLYHQRRSVLSRLL